MKNEKDFSVEYTKISKIREVNNDMVHNYYYLYHGRIYNKEHTRYRKFKLVLYFDVFDVMEQFDKDFINSNDVREYAKELVSSCYYDFKSYNDTEGLKKFYKMCNDTIKEYNGSL